MPAGGANNSSAEKDQLIIYGYHNADDWMQTGYLIPDDSWYDKDHDIVAIFNGGYFHLFVDGVAGSEVRKVTATGEILSRPLTLDNSATLQSAAGKCTKSDKQGRGFPGRIKRC